MLQRSNATSSDRSELYYNTLVLRILIVLARILPEFHQTSELSSESHAYSARCDIREVIVKRKAGKVLVVAATDSAAAKTSGPNSFVFGRTTAKSGWSRSPYLPRVGLGFNVS
jgi:hypothetical protein